MTDRYACHTCLNQGRMREGTNKVTDPCELYFCDECFKPDIPLPPLGSRCVMQQRPDGESYEVTVRSHIKMPNRTYVLVTFDDGDTTTCFGEDLRVLP